MTVAWPLPRPIDPVEENELCYYSYGAAGKSAYWDGHAWTVPFFGHPKAAFCGPMRGRKSPTFEPLLHIHTGWGG